MKTNKSQYVHCMGAIWKLTDKAMARLRKDADRGDVNLNLDSYGKLVIRKYHDLDDIMNGEQQ